MAVDWGIQLCGCFLAMKYRTDYIVGGLIQRLIQHFGQEAHLQVFRCLSLLRLVSLPMRRVSITRLTLIFSVLFFSILFCLILRSTSFMSLLMRGSALLSSCFRSTLVFCLCMLCSNFLSLMVLLRERASSMTSFLYLSLQVWERHSCFSQISDICVFQQTPISPLSSIPWLKSTPQLVLLPLQIILLGYSFCSFSLCSSSSSSSALEAISSSRKYLRRTKLVSLPLEMAIRSQNFSFSALSRMSPGTIMNRSGMLGCFLGCTMATLRGKTDISCRQFSGQALPWLIWALYMESWLKQYLYNISRLEWKSRWSLSLIMLKMFQPASFLFLLKKDSSLILVNSSKIYSSSLQTTQGQGCSCSKCFISMDLSACLLISDFLRATCCMQTSTPVVLFPNFLSTIAVVSSSFIFFTQVMMSGFLAACSLSGEERRKLVKGLLPSLIISVLVFCLFSKFFWIYQSISSRSLICMTRYPVKVILFCLRQWLMFQRLLMNSLRARGEMEGGDREGEGRFLKALGDMRCVLKRSFFLLHSARLRGERVLLKLMNLLCSILTAIITDPPYLGCCNQQSFITNPPFAHRVARKG